MARRERKFFFDNINGKLVTNTTNTVFDNQTENEGFRLSDFANSALQTSSEEFSDVDTAVMTAAAVADKIESYGYSTSSGISNIVEDTTPQLGGNLDSMGYNISNASIITATSFVGNITGTVSTLSNHTTTNLAEGANLYYTDARANSAMDAYLTSITANVDSVNGVTGVVVLDTGDIAENGNLYYTDARARTSVSVTTESPSGNGSLSYNNTSGVFTFTPADTSSISGGGGGSSFTAVATGNISSGVTVALNSDGTVSAVTTSSTTTARSLSDVTYFTQSGVKYGPEAVYDTTNDRLVVFWRDTNNNDYLTCKVGTVSGNSISFGSAVVVETTGAATYYKAVFNSTEGVVVVSYGNNVKVGEVSGTSISFGSASSPFTSPVSDSNTVYISSSPSSGTLCFTSLSSTNNYAVIGTLSGTTLTLGSQQSQSLTASGVLSIFDSSDRLVFVYRNQAQSHYLYAQVCSISGTTITFGTGVQNNGYSNDRVDQLIYDTTNERIIAFCSGNSSQYKVIRPFTITGTYTLSWGTANQWDGNPTAAGQKAVYDPDRNIYLVTGRETNNYIRCWEISIATDSTVTQILNGSETDFHLDSSETHYLAVPVFNSNSGKMLIAYGDGTGSTNGTDGKVKIFTPTTTTITSTNTSFIGISDAAILDTNSGTVTVKGGVASNLSGLTPSSTYYVQANGSLSTTSSSVFAGTALSATELLIGSTSSLADKTTTNLAEGDNLYYTNARARTSVSVSTASPSGNGSLSYNNTTGVFTFTPANTSNITVSGTDVGLTVTNAGTGNGVFIDQNGNGDALVIDSEAAGSQSINIDAVNTSNQTVDIRNAGAQTSGGLMYLYHGHASTSTPVLWVENTGTGNSVFIDNNGSGNALYIDNAGSSPSIYLSANDPTIYFNDVGGTTGDWSIRNSEDSLILRDVSSGIDKFNVSGSGITVTNGQIIEEYATTGTSGAVTIDLNTGNLFSTALAGAVTYTFSNAATSGLASSFTLKVVNDGNSITWPASVDWPGGTAPTLSASGATDVFVFFTHDGGTTWYGFTAGQAMA